MSNLAELIKFPAGDKGWIGKIAIGGVLILIPTIGWVIRNWVLRVVVGGMGTICLFFPMGYVVASLRDIIKGNSDSLPKWSNRGDYFIRGVMCFVVILAYSIIPWLFTALTIVGLTSGRFFSSIAGGFGLWVGSVLGLIAGFFIPMAICEYAAKGNLKPCFQLSKLLDKVKDIPKEYITAYLLAIVLIAICYVTILFLIVIKSWIVAPFLLFYVSLVCARMFGEIYQTDG